MFCLKVMFTFAAKRKSGNKVWRRSGQRTNAAPGRLRRACHAIANPSLRATPAAIRPRPTHKGPGYSGRRPPPFCAPPARACRPSPIIWPPLRSGRLMAPAGVAPPPLRPCRFLLPPLRFGDGWHRPRLPAWPSAGAWRRGAPVTPVSGRL
jgi:hypothetical protein